MDILGIRIDNLDREEALEKIGRFLAGSKPCRISTVNPEFIVESLKNQDFRKVLNSSELNIADGVGVRLAFWRYGKRLKSLIPGADLMMELLRIAQEEKKKVFLLVASDGLSSFSEIKGSILKIFPHLDIRGSNLDRQADFSCDFPEDVFDSDIILCNFGFPDQEITLHSLIMNKNARIKIAMGIGGSFDYLTGKQKRAPLAMRKVGLEWLWRIIRKPGDRPRRWRRIWNAVIIFPIKICLQK